MSKILPHSPRTAKPAPLPAADPELAEIFADPEYAEFLDEMAADREAREDQVAADYEHEHAERFGCDYSGDDC